ncbi:uncharacterized protein L201_004002 [Kwoniella dendrophila CBS 6074]|uniref:RNB domain-containing protein n=1 Tax=Kwoniella dendrophila CBS 6074 TaxID=1295534 RepID=A0AAX4JUP1_9TREE
MASIRLKPTGRSANLIQRSLVTSTRLSDVQSQYQNGGSSSSASSSIKQKGGESEIEIKNKRTFEFLYGPESNWRKPKIPSKPATPPKKRSKVDPEAYKNLPPLENPLASKERKINFSLAEGQSNDRKAYFSDSLSGAEDLGIEDWSSLEIVESEAGLENGRVVECRRSGHTTIGLILASITLSGRPRLLILRSSGEIWPISSNDVQFVMPSSLISPDLASKCWSVELLESLALTESKSGLSEQNEIKPTEEMLQARRKVAMILRKVHRETEKMCNRLLSDNNTNSNTSASNSGGVESIWNNWTSNINDSSSQRSSITAIQAAEFILNPKNNDKGKKIEIKPNTLPAYAAHTLLMRRPDLFIADQGDMWSSGKFVVRSRSERQLLEKVQKGVDQSMSSSPSNESNTDEDLLSFIQKAQKVIEFSRKIQQETQGEELKEVKDHNLPEWTNKDKEYISILLSPLVETRSTQTPPSFPLALSLARLMLPNSNETVDRGTLARLLSDMGIILPWDSLEMSKITENENRSMTMSSIPIPTTIQSISGGKVQNEDGLLEGNELDSIREDFTSHKVFVIDDPTASELDDGIAIERITGSDDIWIHIHIADPTKFIIPNHLYAKQASIRGSTTYLPEGNKPLFPLDVIMGKLSLGAKIEENDNNGSQSTLTFSAKLNNKGDIVDEPKVRLGWIRKPKVITYQSVDKALNLPTSTSTRPFGGPIRSSGISTNNVKIEESDLEDLKILLELAKAHRAKRYSTAGLEWSFPSASVNILNQPSRPSTNLFDTSSKLPSSPQIFSGNLGLEYKVNTPRFGTLNASQIVAEYMILAGKIAAGFCSSRDIPVMYRGSLEPKPLNSSINYTMEDLLNSRIKDMGQLQDPFKMMGNDWYNPSGFIDLKPIQHWIMGFEQVGKNDFNGYLRTTSPLRRFDDFLVHWQIKSYLSKQSQSSVNSDKIKGLNKEEVLRTIKKSDEGVRKLKRSSVTAMKFWQTRVLKNQLSFTNNALINGNDNWEIKDDEKIDLQNDTLIGKIIGSTESVSSINGESTPILIESLGIQATLQHQIKSKDFQVGQEVECKIYDVQDWPNPAITFKLVE